MSLMKPGPATKELGASQFQRRVNQCAEGRGVLDHWQFQNRKVRLWRSDTHATYNLFLK